MPLPLVIVNPASAGGSTGDTWPGIASDLRAHFGSFTPVFTSHPGQATEIANDSARQGTKLIIACGGDGTISEVANGILLSGKDAELGILPSGTGGDFRKTLGVPQRARDAAEILRTGRARRIDVGRVTFTTDVGTQETRYFLGVASLGMTADVIQRVKEGGPEWLPLKTSKWISGRLSFGVSLLQSALQATATRVVVQLDDQPEHHLTVIALCIANARYFGGGMKIAPDAKLDDGKFDIVSVGDLGALRIFTNAPRLYLGAHLGMQEVGHALGAKLVVTPAVKGEQVSIELDGELPGQLPASFQIVPAALRVRTPN
jgi:YegS/Rv2252/BmrU family lipid kinase